MPLVRGDASLTVPLRLDDHEESGTLARILVTIQSVNASVVLEGIDCASNVAGPNQAVIAAATGDGGLFWCTFESVAGGQMFQQWRGAMLLRQGETFEVSNQTVVDCLLGVSAWGYLLPGG